MPARLHGVGGLSDKGGPLIKPTGSNAGPMPTLTRLLLVLVALAGIGTGTIYALGTLVEPDPHEITVRLRMDGFGR